MSTTCFLVQKLDTLDRFRIYVAKLVFITGSEALNPRTLVVCLRFGHCRVQEFRRRGFAVRPTAKHVDECLDLVHLLNANLL